MSNLKTESGRKKKSKSFHCCCLHTHPHTHTPENARKVSAREKKKIAPEKFCTRKL